MLNNKTQVGLMAFILSLTPVVVLLLREAFRGSIFLPLWTIGLTMILSWSIALICGIVAWKSWWGKIAVVGISVMILGTIGQAYIIHQRSTQASQKLRQASQKLRQASQKLRSIGIE